MRLRLGCRFEHEASAPTRGDRPRRAALRDDGGVVAERWSSEPPLETTSFVDLYGNRCRRLVLPEGASVFSYDALATISPEPEPMPGPDDVQHRDRGAPRRAPPLAAREPALRVRRARAAGLGALRRHRAGRGARAGGLRLDPRATSRTASRACRRRRTVEVFERRGGMCRDFAHLGVTFCRALGIPARYVFGYMPDIGIPGPYPPMDFHAWFEVWLGTSWWTYDARFNTPRIGRLPIGRGRDAVDVAMVTTYGAASLRRMIVWADEVADDAELTPRRSLAPA